MFPNHSNLLVFLMNIRSPDLRIIFDSCSTSEQESELHRDIECGS